MTSEAKGEIPRVAHGKWQTLEIRHQIVLRGDQIIVIERFGDQPPLEFKAADRASAEQIVADRKAALLKMVADISPEASAAVDDARHIDNMKAGHG